MKEISGAVLDLIPLVCGRLFLPVIFLLGFQVFVIPADKHLKYELEGEALAKI